MVLFHRTSAQEFAVVTLNSGQGLNFHTAGSAARPLFDPGPPGQAPPDSATFAGLPTRKAKALRVDHVPADRLMDEAVLYMVRAWLPTRCCEH